MNYATIEIEINERQYTLDLELNMTKGQKMSNYDRHGDPNPPSDPDEMEIEKITLYKVFEDGTVASKNVTKLFDQKWELLKEIEKLAWDEIY